MDAKQFVTDVLSWIIVARDVSPLKDNVIINVPYINLHARRETEMDALIISNGVHHEIFVRPIAAPKPPQNMTHTECGIVRPPLQEAIPQVADSAHDGSAQVTMTVYKVDNSECTKKGELVDYCP